MRTAEAGAPLGDSELQALFAPLTSADRIALAVSGGPDSLALLDCVARWRKARGGRPEAHVLTVDHGLRESSAGEAASVARLAETHGLPARVLVWHGPHPSGDVEAAARAARYRLLIGAAREIGASHLVLAHHCDDQAETFLMRLARGAGVFGLAAMRPLIALDGLVLARPFLEVPKTRLAATARAAGLSPVEDVMNVDPRFARARLRRAMPVLAEEGIDPERIAATARRLAGAAAALDLWASRVIEAAVTVDRCAVARLVAAAFLAEPAEIRLRVLTRLLGAIGGELYPPRFARLAALAEMMVAEGRLKRTLAGAVVERRGDGFLVYREVGRAGLPQVRPAAGTPCVWDHRFTVTVGEGAPAGLTLGALGEAGRRAIGLKVAGVPAAALAALPAIRRGDRVLAVPAAGFVAPGRRRWTVAARAIVADRLAEPPLFPDFGAAQ